MFQNFGYEIADLLKKAENIRYELHHPYVGTEHLLLAILKTDSKEKEILNEFGLTAQSFLDELSLVVGHPKEVTSINLYTPMLKRVLELALNEAEASNNGQVNINHLLMAMLEEADGVAIRILLRLNIDLDDLYDALKENISSSKKARNLEIMKVGINLTSKNNKTSKLYGREDEIDLIIETLLRKEKNNPLLIGKAGVGKTAIVEELARRIVKKEVPLELQNMEVYELEMGSLVAGTKYRGEFEERLTKIIKEVIKEKNIIIFIDEIHSMVNAGGAEGAICASDILKPYLARGEIKVIGSTTISEYHEYIENDQALARRFEKIVVQEPSDEDMLLILKKVKPIYENHYHLTLNNENLQDLLNLANTYIFSKNNPDKTLDLLDSVCARIKLKNSNLNASNLANLETMARKKAALLKKGEYKNALQLAKEEQEIKNLKNTSPTKLTMTRNDILEVIEKKTNMPLTNNQKNLFSKLRTNLFSNIYGQDDILNKLLDTLENSNQKNISFLLVGGSGVGKTKSVKIISETLKTNLIRIDMSEYHLEESINRLIGAPSGYVGYNKSYVFQSLIDHPYSTVLFDEIEKAHPKVLNLLLQILDEGFITDSLGNKIRFDHTYIFMTSNIRIAEKIGFNSCQNDALENVLSKELLGRIDAVLAFNPISEEVALKYIEKHLKNPQIKAIDLLNSTDITKYGLRNLENLINKYNKKTVNYN